ncbi:MAG: hypothetical protein GEEBNDBF_00957 [bacterium]|nr:hypothetical protein [bacterium]
MSDWPTYETAPASTGERSPLASQAPQSSASAVPAWIGVTLALTVGLLLAMSVVAISAASSALQLRSELTLVKSELASMQKDVQFAKEEAARVAVKVADVESDIVHLSADHAELVQALRQAEEQASARRQQSGFFDFLSILAPLLGF